MTHIFYQGWLKKAGLLLLAAILLNGYDSALAQTTTVLPSNGNVGGNVSPQGGLRYQRGFYLVTPAEMNASGLTSGMNINSIGFTLARAQSDTTMGNFKVYLQNTTDLVSRYDTGWSTVTSNTNSYSATGLVPGNYEWKVQANCVSTSPFAPAVNFSNNNSGGCNNPYNLETAFVNTDSVALTWEASTSPGFTTYQVEYKRLDSVNWISVNTTNKFFRVGGLASNKQYQWRVKTICGSSNSEINASSFFTAPINTCASLSGLNATAAQAQVTFSWTADTLASYYDLRFRRFGTTAWTSVISVNDTISILLTAGTTYEWQVRTMCGAGATGPYAASTITTGGTTVCYAPIDLVTRQITDSSAVFSWKPVSGATNYTIQYRLKRAISWANAITPMTKTCDSVIDLINKTGAYDITFHGGDTFNYTGNGVYIAWEYSNPSGALSAPNLALTTNRGTSILGANGQDSVSNLLSMISQADSSLTSMPTVLNETSQRPETRLGSDGLKDSVGVIALYALGQHIPRFQSSAAISALVANFSATTKSLAVTLTVKERSSGTVRYTNTQTVSVTATDTLLVSFDGWSPTLFEQDVITVSIPAQTNENVVGNNSKSYLQNVNASILAYDDGSSVVSAAGFGTVAGLLLNKHIVTGCAQVLAAKVFLTESAKGNPLKAVIKSKTGSIVAESASFTATEDDINKYHSFAFTTPASFTNDTFYIGIAQQASTIPSYPIGSQWEGDQTRTGAYFRANTDSTPLIDYPQGGRLMIRAEIVSSSPEVSIDGNITLCSGATNTLTAVSLNTRFANSVKSFSSQYANNDYGASQVLGSPNVFPAYALSPNSWMGATTEGQREYLVLGFANPGKINYVDIFETANPGAVDSVFVKNAEGSFVLVYSATATAAPFTARKNHITFTETTFDVSEIRIAINSPAVAGYNAIDAVGIGKETKPGIFTSYLWTPGGETTAEKSVSAAGTYTLTVTNSSGCTSTDSIKVVDALTTPPVITASGSTSICSGDSVRLTSNIATNITWSNGATTPSIWIKAAGSYSVTYSGGICGTLTSDVITVSINALPTPTITGLLEICLGNQNQLDAGAGYSRYLWSTGDTTQTISISSEGRYSVRVTSANGCKASASATAVYAVLAPPTITGNLNFCPGASTTLDAGAGYASYLWNNGATTQTITVTTPGGYDVEVTNAGGCSASASVEVTRFAAPVPVINGVAGFCAGNSTTLTVDGVYASYLWSDGVTTASTSFNTSGNKSVTVIDSNGCSGTKTIIVEAFPSPAPVISGTLSFCGGLSTTLNAGGGYSSYLWTPGNATTQTIVVNAVGTYTVTVVNANGCSASASVTTTQTSAIPASPGTITGPVIVSCSSTGIVYSIAAVANTSHYVWKMPVGASISSGQGTTAIAVNFSTEFVGGYIEVAASNACGQSPSITARKLFVQSLPNAPGNISGQSTALCGNTTITYSIAAVPYATGYTWIIPAGTTIVSGQGTTSLRLRINANFGTGSLCVRANNACGSGPATCMTITGKPPVPGAITGADRVCTSEDNLPYSIVAVHGATSYTWTVPQSAQITSGQGTSRILVKMGSQSGNVTVRANSTCGNSTARVLAITAINCNNSISSVAPELQITQIRPVPEVISSYGGFNTAGNLSIEWTMGETMVESNATGEMLYTQGFHQPLVVAKDKQTSIVVSDNLLINVFPNPVRTYLNIEFKTILNRIVSLELFDNNGRLLQRKQTNTDVNATAIQMMGYSKGSYYLVVKDTSGKILKSIKLVKNEN